MALTTESECKITFFFVTLQIIPYLFSFFALVFFYLRVVHLFFLGYIALPVGYDEGGKGQGYDKADEA